MPSKLLEERQPSLYSTLNPDAYSLYLEVRSQIKTSGHPRARRLADQDMVMAMLATVTVLQRRFARMTREVHHGADPR